MDISVENFMVEHICDEDIFMDNVNENLWSFYQSKKIFKAKLVRVIDGDTIVVEQLIDGDNGNECQSGRSYKLRFYGIDAPETAKDCRKGQPFQKTQQDMC